MQGTGNAKGGAFQIEMKDFNLKTVLEGPTKNHHCHCEAHRAVAISWYNVQIRTQYQEIATSLRSSQ